MQKAAWNYLSFCDIVYSNKFGIWRNLHDKDLGLGEKTEDNAAVY